MVSWFDLACAWGIVEGYLGWLPCLALHSCHRRCQPDAATIQRLRDELADSGVRLPLGIVQHQLAFGTALQILRALCVLPLLRFDDAALQGPWWHGRTLPRTELRVFFRYHVQNPRRRWPRRLPGNPIGVHRLPHAFPGAAFAGAIPLLQDLGSRFHLHQVAARRYSDHYGYIEGMRIDVTSLYCVVCGFELLLRCTTAHEFDPEAPSTDSDGTINDDD